VSRSAGSGDYDLESATGGGFAPLDHSLWGAVRREHLDLALEAKVFENLNGVGHDRPV
jgi:hypothetical protein